MLILFQLLQPVLSLTCPSYGCAPTTYVFPASTCLVQVNSSSIYVKPCIAPQTCNTETSKCSVSTTPTSQSLPGSTCALPSTCISNNCTQQTCRGLPRNSACQDHQDCDVGLRCSSSICTPQLSSGEFGCSDDYDCVNSAGCNITSTATKGTCLAYLSVSTGAAVSDCSGGVSKLCKSSECFKSASFGTNGICKVATQSVGVVPTPCTSNFNCVGNDGKYSYTGTCSCGYNKNGTAYCNLFNGDLAGLGYYLSWKNALNASVGVCSTVGRFGVQCLQKVGYYKKVMQATWGFLMMPMIQNNDICVETALTNEYYDVVSEAIYVIGWMSISLFSLL